MVQLEFVRTGLLAVVRGGSRSFTNGAVNKGTFDRLSIDDGCLGSALFTR